ncbi:SDR family NAD(P)-dependent oxidoreductase [Variovorax saccharolyticus]|uniref:SDR family NAD(P)-dependent oxidoreductase n=1 Tax=Variovorax saccharolyticus TaxID=3053516 RepID=UPI002575DFA8|nr:SDR family oxidoreductase [Variovorax sp. J31P216]MDM0028693.1 SDR family oxidoreductase [Variovorax sp. J31P216]
MKVEGAVALVTGGAQGLGLAIARRLADEGATVVVADRNGAALANLTAGLEGVSMDVTDPEGVKTTVASLFERHDRLDILVNNAGVIFSEPFVNIMNPAGIMHDYGRFRASLTVNLDSVFIVTAAVVEHMVKRRIKGAIINISSISALGNEGQTAYSAAKAGVNAMTVTWAKELGRWGIRTNAVAPGFIGTDSTRQALSESVLKHIQANTPLRRLGHADEVAQAVIALVENDFINGTVLDVNGGLTI